MKYQFDMANTDMVFFFAYLGGHGLSIGLLRASNPPFFSYSGEEARQRQIQRPPGLVGFPNQLHRLAHDPLPQSTKFWPIINCTSHRRANSAFLGDPYFDPWLGGRRGRPVFWA